MAQDGVLILADDLTGAADTAVALSGAHAPARVVLGLCPIPPAGGEPAVLSLDLHTRGMAQTDARQCMAEAGREAWASGRRLFKKIDSTWRGHVGAELAALATALEPDTLFVLAAAHPELGRTVNGGRLSVHGQAADRAPLQQELQAQGLACHQVPSATQTDPVAWEDAWRQASQLPGRTVVLCDAVSTEDLRRTVRATQALGRRFAWVGSGGLAQAIAAVARPAAGCESGPIRSRPADVPPPGDRWFVVGSHAPIARAQVDALAAAGAVSVVDLSMDALRLTQSEGPATAHARALIRQARLAGHDIVLRPAPAMAVTPTDAAAVSQGLACWAASILTGAKALIVCGGDTARTLLDRVGVRELLVRPSAEVGTSVAAATGLPGLPILLKAGAFGDASLLSRLGKA
jgi:uncharacterized protein YgbK (DUF1537 family)